MLAEAGIDYVADWCNDEQPYSMKTRKGPIVAMPYTLEIGDIPVFLMHGGTGEDFYRMIVDQFDTLYEDGAAIYRVLSISLHPFLIGHPFRAKHLERALAHIRKHDAVWIATGTARSPTGTTRGRCVEAAVGRESAQPGPTVGEPKASSSQRATDDEVRVLALETHELDAERHAFDREQWQVQRRRADRRGRVVVPGRPDRAAGRSVPVRCGPA